MKKANFEILSELNLSDELCQDELCQDEQKQYHDILLQSDNLKLPEYNISNAFEKLGIEKNAKKKRTISYRPHIYLAIAASIALLIGFGLKQLFFNHTIEIKTVQTACAEKQSVNLPDGSEVHLNSGSSLEYTPETWKDNRELQLDGEAYFKVEKGEKFTVKTTLGDVSVLGTSFNVKCRENEIEVVCFTGKVKVESGDFTKVLTAGDAIKLSNGLLVRNWKVNSTESSWMSGVTELDSVPFEVALDELQRQFNLKISEINITDTVTVDFPHDDPEIAIEQILAPLEIEYTYNKSTRELIIHEE